MPAIQTTVWLPEELWQAVQVLAPEEGDANTVVLRALEEYLLRSHRQRRRTQSGKYKKLVGMPPFIPAARVRLLDLSRCR